MKIENVNSRQNFTAVKQGISMSDELFSKITKTQVVKTFAKKYDAELNLDMYQSSRIKSNEGFIALTVSGIKPANVLTRITDLFKRPVKGIVLKTHATNDADFIKSLNSKNKYSLIDIYNDASHR